MYRGQGFMCQDFRVLFVVVTTPLADNMLLKEFIFCELLHKELFVRENTKTKK